MEPAVTRYENFLMDSARWNEIELRDGDIVISTPPKSGTTWVQMICALLIFQRPELPRPLSDISPWVDMLTLSRAELRAEYESQTHRRFFKTHTPLDGLPYDERVTYICVARDPLDAAISWDHQMANFELERAIELREQAAAADGLVLEPPPPPIEPPPTLGERLLLWIDGEEPVNSLHWVVRHLTSFWQVRDRANLLFYHFDDLKEDLDGQMRRLAEELGITVPEARWEELVEAATFSGMRNRGETTIPERRFWRDPEQFLRRGTSGQWRTGLDPEVIGRYATRLEELTEPELIRWLHRGPAPVG